MADRYWVNAAADNDWHNAGNWSATDGGAGGAGVPTPADDVFFTGAVVANCEASDTTIACASLTVTYQYTGTIDFRPTNPTVAVGNCDIAQGGKTSTVAGTLYTGTGTWTISGNWDSGRKQVVWGGLAVFTGTAKTIKTYFNSNAFYRVEIQGSLTTASWSGYSGPSANGPASSSDTLLVKSGASLTINTTTSITNGSLTVESGGVINGSGRVTYAGHIGSTMNVAGTISTATFNLACYRVVIAPCTIDSATVGITNWGDSAYTLQAGTYTFKGNVSVDSTKLIWNSSTVAANYVFQGDLTLGASITWRKSTGTITFNSTADQTVDLEDKTVEDIIVNKSAGTIAFSDGFTADSLTLTAGTIAFGATPDTITCSGNWTIGTGGQVDPTNLGGWTWSVGGNLSLSGESGDLLNLVATAAWYLQVTGTATASYITADYSDASGYTEIDADDGTNTDGGHNTNWAFGAAFSGSPWYAYAQM